MSAPQCFNVSILLNLSTGGFCELTGGPVHSLHGKVDLPPTTTTTAHHAVNNTTYVDRRLVHLQGKKFGPGKKKKSHFVLQLLWMRKCWVVLVIVILHCTTSPIVKFKGVLDETSRLPQEDSRQNIWTWPRNGSMLPEKGSYERSLKIRTAPQPEPERRFNRYQTGTS